MTRATDTPPATDHEQEPPWEHLEGDTPDSATAQALNLAHRAAEKFPELAKRYRNLAAPAAVASGVLVLLAGVAVSRRMRRGQHAEEALDQLTAHEIEQAATVTHRHNRVWQMVRRIARRRYPEGPGEAS